MSLKLLKSLAENSVNVVWLSQDKMEVTLRADGPSSNTILDLEERGYISIDRAFSPNGSEIRIERGRDAQQELAARSKIIFRVPRTLSGIVIAKNLADLLSIEIACTRSPREYFLWDDGFAFESHDSIQFAPKLVKHYHEALHIVSILTSLKDHRGTDGNLLFFHLQKLEICPHFGVADLNWKIHSKEISDFLGNLAEPDRKKIDIFRSVLCSFLREQPKDQRLGYLIRRSEDFARTLEESLALYLSENSPEKITEEAQKSWLSLTEKLEKVILGMEAKSLAIPVALLLAVKEIELGENFTPVNMVILLASLLFSATLVFFHFSQKSILNIIVVELDTSEADLKRKGLTEKNRILGKSFPSLKNRARNTGLGSLVMALLGCTPLLVCVWAAFWAQPKPSVANQPQQTVQKAP